RSYGAILPSSLTRVLPLTFGFSPRLPVSVCGTGTCDLARGFSWQCGFGSFGTLFPSPSQLGIIGRICLSNFLTALLLQSSAARLSGVVCGTGTFDLARGFSGPCGFGLFGTLSPSPSPLRIIRRLCLSNFLPAWTPPSSGAHFLSDCVSPSLERSRGGAGISTCLPSPTPFGLGLGPD